MFSVVSNIIQVQNKRKEDENNSNNLQPQEGKPAIKLDIGWLSDFDHWNAKTGKQTEKPEATSSSSASSDLSLFSEGDDGIENEDAHAESTEAKCAKKRKASSASSSSSGSNSSGLSSSLDNEDWNDEEEKEKEKAELLADLLLLLEREEQEEEEQEVPKRAAKRPRKSSDTAERNVDYLAQDHTMVANILTQDHALEKLAISELEKNPQSFVSTFANYLYENRILFNLRMKRGGVRAGQTYAPPTYRYLTLLEIVAYILRLGDKYVAAANIYFNEGGTSIDIRDCVNEDVTLWTDAKFSVYVQYLELTKKELCEVLRRMEIALRASELDERDCRLFKHLSSVHELHEDEDDDFIVQIPYLGESTKEPSKRDQGHVRGGSLFHGARTSKYFEKYLVQNVLHTVSETERSTKVVRRDELKISEALWGSLFMSIVPDDTGIRTLSLENVLNRTTCGWSMWQLEVRIHDIGKAGTFAAACHAKLLLGATETEMRADYDEQLTILKNWNIMVCKGGMEPGDVLHGWYKEEWIAKLEAAGGSRKGKMAPEAAAEHLAKIVAGGGIGKGKMAPEDAAEHLAMCEAAGGTGKGNTRKMSTEAAAKFTRLIVAGSSIGLTYENALTKVHPSLMQKILFLQKEDVLLLLGKNMWSLQTNPEKRYYQKEGRMKEIQFSVTAEGHYLLRDGEKPEANLKKFRSNAGFHRQGTPKGNHWNQHEGDFLFFHPSEGAKISAHLLLKMSLADAVERKASMGDAIVDHRVEIAYGGEWRPGKVVDYIDYQHHIAHDNDCGCEVLVLCENFENGIQWRKQITSSSSSSSHDLD